jgi:hypothetical protein
MRKQNIFQTYFDRFKSVLNSVSTRPNYEAYSWGSRQSTLARGLYETIFFLRLLSPLQWVKYFTRKHQERGRGHSDFETKPRPDFHAATSEFYLIGVLFFSILFFNFSAYAYFYNTAFLSHHPWLCKIVDGIALFLLVESLHWTLYYAAVRPLVERRPLNLFDEAEYLVTLPIALLTQMLFLAGLWRKDLLNIGLLFLNSNSSGRTIAQAVGFAYWNNPNTRFQILCGAIIGQAYLVIVLASLIRIVPPLHVRKRPTLTVIGYGDVVQARILPALLEVYRPRQIAVAADQLTFAHVQKLRNQGIRYYSVLPIVESRPPGQQRTYENEAYIVQRIVHWVSNHSRFAIIAVPTHHHFQYMLALSKHSVRFAVEKPLIATESELNLVAKPEFAEIFKNAFVLSYYWLEKALPLNYLLSLNPVYRPLLVFKKPGSEETEYQISTRDIEMYVSSLGSLTSIEIELLESDETLNRYWTELRANGGMALETLIHPLTLALNLARYTSSYDPQKGLWDFPPKVEWRKNLERAQKVKEATGLDVSATLVEVSGHLCGGARVHIRCGKYVVAEAHRFLIAEFHNGWLTCDLNTMIARLIHKRGDVAEIVLEVIQTNTPPSQRSDVSTKFTKYQQQIDLVNTFFVDGWGGIRFDDYPSQLDVLREIFSLIKTLPNDMDIPSDAEVSEWPGISVHRMKEPDRY